MFSPETPITEHDALPEDIPLIADFHDDRNRLSYYHPRLEQLQPVQTPTTKFFPITGGINSIPTCNHREITKFMQDLNTTNAFIRGDFSSSKISQDGRILTSQDAETITQTISELLKGLYITERHLGRRVAVREYIPHDTEIRYFIRNGSYYYHEQLTDENFPNDPISLPKGQIKTIAEEFSHFGWSVDFILHEDTKEWYCIDMGLDGLYYNDNTSEWVAISEHPDKTRSPEQYSDVMPNPNRFTYQS